MVANAKKIGLIVSGAASQKYMRRSADHQEVMGAMADIVIEGFAMDSVLARTLKLIEEQGEAAAALRHRHDAGLSAGSDRADRGIGSQARHCRRRRRRHAAHADDDPSPPGEVEPFNTIGLTQQIATE